MKLFKTHKGTIALIISILILIGILITPLVESKIVDLDKFKDFMTQSNKDNSNNYSLTCYSPSTKINVSFSEKLTVCSLELYNQGVNNSFKLISILNDDKIVLKKLVLLKSEEIETINWTSNNCDYLVETTNERKICNIA